MSDVSLVTYTATAYCWIAPSAYTEHVPHRGTCESKQYHCADAPIACAGSSGEAMYGVLASGGGGMADWRSSLAVLAANRTPGDEAVFIRLGDRLWYEQGQVSPPEESSPESTTRPQRSLLYTYSVCSVPSLTSRFMKSCMIIMITVITRLSPGTRCASRPP